jgi:hypothetical protein
LRETSVFVFTLPPIARGRCPSDPLVGGAGFAVDLLPGEAGSYAGSRYTYGWVGATARFGSPVHSRRHMWRVLRGCGQRSGRGRSEVRSARSGIGVLEDAGRLRRLDPPGRARPARRGVDPGHRARSLIDTVGPCRRRRVLPRPRPADHPRAGHKSGPGNASTSRCSPRRERPSGRSRAPAPAPARQRPEEP